MVDIAALKNTKSPDELIAALKALPSYRILRAGEQVFDNIKGDIDQRPRSPLWRTDDPITDNDEKNPKTITGGFWEPQRLVYNNRSQIAVLVGGYGVGKTTVGVKKTVAMALTNDGVPSVAIAPTIAQSNRYHVPNFEYYFKGKGIPYKWVGGDKRYFTFKHQGARGKIFCLSGHRPESIVGDTFGSVWLDEPFKMDEAVFRSTFARMRAPDAVYRQMIMTGTPEQLGWGYDLCINGYQGISPYVVVAPTTSNKSLPVSYLKGLIGIMDDRTFKAYFLGHFINLSSGIVFYGFDEDRNCNTMGDIGIPVHVGMDFNVSPMSAVVGWYSRGHLHIFDEITIDNADTPYMCSILKEKYGGRIEAVYPDPSGARRSGTAGASGRTDHEAIEQFGWEVRAPGQILRRDSENAMNAAMRPMQGPPKVTLYKPNLPKLTSNLLELDHENLKKQDRQGKTHLPDAMKYMVHWFFPPERSYFEPSQFGV